jgi:branched-chain amino acid transport system ATP-binding protein
MLPPTIAPGGMSISEIYDMFPQPQRARQQPRHVVRRRAADAGVHRILRTGARLLLLTKSPRAWPR